MPNREHLLQMIGMSNTLVGNVNGTEEPSTKSKRCWDGDTLSRLGFSNIQVGGIDCDADHENQEQGVSFLTKVWKVQGAAGTNPLKVKRKVTTNHKTCDMANAHIIKAK